MEQQLSRNQWIVNATEAKQLISQGATILDVRNIVVWLLGHISGAVRITWQQFSQQQSPHKGKLLDNVNLLEQKIRAVGVCNNKPVIVVGNPAHSCNFGEEGRIVWMLRTLGHKQAVFVDGGYAAIAQAGIPVDKGITQLKNIGDFIVKRTSLWEIQCDEIQASLVAKQDLIVIDTRSVQEFAGATFYGEHRGGHIPGAIHFYFKDLIDINGYLLSPDQIIAKMKKLGIERDSAIATYCTGGVRSAFFVTVLANLGFDNVKNYAGSMWEWSKAPATTYPLNKAI